MRIGVDLGGTKIEAIALDSAGAELLRRRIATPVGDYPKTVQAIADMVRGIEQETGQTGSVGIGTPGAISPRTGLIKNANSTVLIGHPLDRDVGRALGRPVRIANDADCFALSEAVDGAGAGASPVFGVILGTGVGGGLVFGGQLIKGPNAIAGEWGHNPLPWPRDEERPGPTCYCGKRGCIESFLSGPAVRKAYAARTGRVLMPEQIDDADFWKTYSDRLARALATVINILDPEVIVLGGGLSNVERLYAEVPQRLPKYVFSDHVATRVVRAAHGDSSGVRGAAWLWPA
ncbi:MAG: ROK family protein [Pseudomonadota bacterium]|nr:ROK family protein [Pseudomonadota bacterium]